MFGKKVSLESQSVDGESREKTKSDEESFSVPNQMKNSWR